MARHYKQKLIPVSNLSHHFLLVDASDTTDIDLDCLVGGTYPSLCARSVLTSCSTRSTCRFMSTSPPAACKTRSNTSRFTLVGMTSFCVLTPISPSKSVMRIAALGFGWGSFVDLRCTPTWSGCLVARCDDVALLGAVGRR
jgi:hypothetical protein